MLYPFSVGPFAEARTSLAFVVVVLMAVVLLDPRRPRRMLGGMLAPALFFGGWSEPVLGSGIWLKDRPSRPAPAATPAKSRTSRQTRKSSAQQPKSVAELIELSEKAAQSGVGRLVARVQQKLRGAFARRDVRRVVSLESVVVENSDAADHLSDAIWRRMLHGEVASLSTVAHLATCFECAYQLGRLSMLPAIAEAQRAELLREVKDIRADLQSALKKESLDPSNVDMVKKFIAAHRQVSTPKHLRAVTG